MMLSPRQLANLAEVALKCQAPEALAAVLAMMLRDLQAMHTVAATLDKEMSLKEPRGQRGMS